jgi:hypothetical protein
MEEQFHKTQSNFFFTVQNARYLILAAGASAKGDFIFLNLSRQQNRQSILQLLPLFHFLAFAIQF